LSRVQSNICWHKAILTWLKEGDANSKCFHGVMSFRRRRNAIQMIQVNGVQVQGVQNIREAVFSHFSSHFKVTQV